MKIFTLELSIALFLLFLAIAANVLLGAVKAEFKGDYNKDTFKRGIIKGMAIIVGVSVIAIASSLDETLMFNDQPILEYVLLTVKAAYIYYYGQVVTKTFSFIKTPSQENVIDAEVVNEEYIQEGE